MSSGVRRRAASRQALRAAFSSGEPLPLLPAPLRRPPSSLSCEERPAGGGALDELEEELDQVLGVEVGPAGRGRDGLDGDAALAQLALERPPHAEGARLHPVLPGRLHEGNGGDGLREEGVELALPGAARLEGGGQGVLGGRGGRRRGVGAGGLGRGGGAATHALLERCPQLGGGGGPDAAHLLARELLGDGAHEDGAVGDERGEGRARQPGDVGRDDLLGQLLHPDGGGQLLQLAGAHAARLEARGCGEAPQDGEQGGRAAHRREVDWELLGGEVLDEGLEGEQVNDPVVIPVRAESGLVAVEAEQLGALNDDDLAVEDDGHVGRGRSGRDCDAIDRALCLRAARAELIELGLVAEGLERRLGEEGVAGRLVGDGDVKRVAGRAQGDGEGARLVDVLGREDGDGVLALVRPPLDLAYLDNPVSWGTGGGAGPGHGHLDDLAGHLVHHEGGLAREALNGRARAGPWRDAGRCEGAPVERMRTRRRATHCAEGGGCGFKLRAVTARYLSAVTSRPPVPMITSPRLTSTTRLLHAVKGVSPCVSCGALRWPIGYEEREKPDVGKSQSYVARSRPCEGASPDGGTARGDGGTGQRTPPRELLSQPKHVEE
jgi:hypothetical protein